MPLSPSSISFNRIWKFVDRFRAGDEVERQELDIALDDLTAGLNAALQGGFFAVGDWAATSGAFPTARPDASAIRARDAWYVTAAGTVDGISFAIGDYLIATRAGGGLTYAGNWHKTSATVSQMLGLTNRAETAAEAAEAAQLAAENAQETAEDAALILESVAYPVPVNIPTVANQQDYAMRYDPGRSDRVWVFLNGKYLLPNLEYLVVQVSGTPTLRLLVPVNHSNQTISYIGTRVLAYDPNLNRVEASESRTALVTHIAENGATSGHEYRDGWRSYLCPPLGHAHYGLSPIPDLSNLIPLNGITPEHFGPIDGADDQVQINLAIAWADTIGGGVVDWEGEYVVSPSGTWSTSNGDLNACIRVETTNAVYLRGVPGRTRVTQAGTRISHVVSFGRRVGTSLPSKGGISNTHIIGNRATALDEGVPFPGGMGIMVAGPGIEVQVTGNRVENAYAYGIGFQRAWWQSCLVERNWIETPGNDGIDCKYDYLGDTGADPVGTLEAGLGDNWVRHNFVDRPAKRWANLVGQKAGIDIRNGWNSAHNTVVVDVPACAFRFQSDDEAVRTPELGMGSLAPDSDPATMRYFMSGTGDKAYFLDGGTLSGNDAAATLMEAKGFQISVFRPHLSDIYAFGFVQNFWIRSDWGRYFGLKGRGATSINLAVYGQGGTGILDNEFYGIDMADAALDVRVYGASGHEPQRSKFFGGQAGSVQIDAGVQRTLLMLDYTTLTDSGTDTLRIAAGDTGRLRAGRTGAQFVEIDGDPVSNRVTARSAAGVPKPFVISNDAEGTDLTIFAENGAVELAALVAAVITNVLTVNGAGDIRLFDLPTTAPATSNRLWRDPAAGNVIKIVP